MGEVGGGGAGRSAANDALFTQVREMCEEAAVSLRDHVEALLEAKQEAIRVASDEREKAASALRDQLTERIATGDLNLREHITAQIAQLRQMVESAERLELARFEELQSKLDQLNEAGHNQVEQRIAGVQREVALVQTAAQTAITKAEVAVEKRFESVNEFRAEARAVREAQQSDMSRLAAQLMPREVADAKFVELAKLIDALESRDRERAGRSGGVAWTVGAGVGVLGVIISLVVVLANVLTPP